MSHAIQVPRDLTNEVQGTGRKIGKRMLKRQRPENVPVPFTCPEELKISGFAFSKRFRRAAGLRSASVPETRSEWEELMRYGDLAGQIEADSQGGPTVGINAIQIMIDDQHPRAGRKGAGYILMKIGPQHEIKLWGNKTEPSFPRGWWFSWDLTSMCSDYLETIPTDAWDEIFLENPSADGILLRRIKIVHSGVTILDWRCRKWLDASRDQAFGRLGLAAQILRHKLRQIENSWAPQLHWAARELGKSDWRKYGDDPVWCSEFASWCLRKALWHTPTGPMGSQTLENWFQARKRKFTLDDLKTKKYTLTMGDYLRVNNGNHSALFVRYEDGDPVTGPAKPKDSTRLRTIEGNASKTVLVWRERPLGSITSVGSTR